MKKHLKNTAKILLGCTVASFVLVCSAETKTISIGGNIVSNSCAIGVYSTTGTELSSITLPDLSLTTLNALTAIGSVTSAATSTSFVVKPTDPACLQSKLTISWTPLGAGITRPLNTGVATGVTVELAKSVAGLPTTAIDLSTAAQITFTGWGGAQLSTTSGSEEYAIRYYRTTAPTTPATGGSVNSSLALVATFN